MKRTTFTVLGGVVELSVLSRTSCRMTDQPSGKLYTAVTKYWPRMAAGLVVFDDAVR